LKGTPALLQGFWAHKIVDEGRIVKQLGSLCKNNLDEVIRGIRTYQASQIFTPILDTYPRI